METETWNQSEIIELSKGFVCLRIDMQQWKSLRDQYDRMRLKFRVDVVPSTIITDPLGYEFYHGEGFIRASDLQKVMKTLPRNLFSVYQALKVLDAEPASVIAKINAAVAYHRIRVAHISNKLLEEVIGLDTLKKDPVLEESVETYRAINYHLLGEAQKSIDLFERLLDRFPHGEKQPLQLYYLAKLYLQNFNETLAKKYFRILQRQFPNHTYTKQAKELFKK
jgi:tetratricopeptide (TPR) repeat protein